MTKEQEEAIKFLELHTNFMGKLDKGRCIRIPEKNFTKTKQSIETLLNMLKEKELEIEKYKKLLADNLAKNLNDSIKAKEKADTDLDDLNKGWQVELEKKDKMIDLMAEYISDLDIDEDICKKQSDNNCDDINREVECKECIKQYFERKVEDECKR